MQDRSEVSAIHGRGEFQEAIRQAFIEAADAGWREIRLVDLDFAEWPLGEKSVIENLTRWAKPYRSLVIVANHFDEVARRHPRWVAWRQLWSHIVQCRANTELESTRMPTLLCARGGVTIRVHERTHHRGTLSRRVIDVQSAWEEIDNILLRSEESFPATTLGI